ncbi:MAG TPA: translation initiation factor IF-2 [Candidatus Onthocola gallistercoris]|uniref:Translation initiation factor IF-2 n=1 Tax=Candidatus Onthocola gallistercoris TaxID=2840876 RepID=A0A9D1HEB7_9FIRM|nr:translation initiation factor IF-2 [Candidatus Onthocola gallistercoris]
MSKIRVHELAKELGKSSKDVIYALKGHGIVVESHMSTITDDTADKIRKYFTQPSRPARNQQQETAPRREEKTPRNQERQPFSARTQSFDGRPGYAGGERRQGNRDNNGERRPFNRDNNQRQGNRDNNGERRPYNRDNNGERRPFNRDNNGERRPFNRDNSQRQGNRDNNGERRPYNRDNNGERRPFNRDNNGERRPFNRDNSQRQGNRDNNGERRPYNRDNNQRQGGYNNNRGGRSFGGERKFNLDSAISKEVVVSKDTTRENRRNYKDNRDRDKAKNVTDGRSNRKGFGGKQLSKKNAPHPPVQKPKQAVEKVTNIVLPEVITLKELGDKMKISGAEIVKKLFMAGKMVSLNTEITYEEAEEIALDYDILCEHEVVIDPIEEILKDEEEDESLLQPRPPVVCVMGHVDHGKTSILDKIRDTHVTRGEAGGITQHIGAYVVEFNGQKITFLDTPGHEAFTAMRLRGAQSTDIAILVVAADDGVMPQTIEAISHAKAAGIEVIVAINKIDKPSANVERVKQELTEYELVPEDWGGTTLFVPVSAHTGEGLDELLETILLQAEMCELKANPNRNARGLVLEAQLDKGRGPVATVLVQKGTLHVGDNLAVGTAFGRVRAMIDDQGRRVKKAGPSIPVEILGLNDVPEAGETFIATDSEKQARSIAETFIATKREKLLAETKSRLSLDGLFDQIQAGQIKELNIIVKADVQGSVEAVKQSLLKLSNDEVAIKIIHGAVGAINESDVTLASTSNAIIIGFNVRPDNMAKTLAESEKVDMRLYRVIYNAIEDIEAAMKGMLDPEFQEKIIGHAEVRQTYKVSGVGTIIGGYVLDGKVERNCKVRLLRDNVVMYEGNLASLKRFKDDVKEVAAGYECGMSLEKYNDIKEGDKIEAFVMEEIPR